MKRAMTITLYANAIIASLAGIFVYVLRAVPDPVVAQSAALARGLGAWELGFAIACLVIARNFRGEPRWLLVTIPLFAIGLTDSVYELIVTPGAPIIPVVLRTVFLGLYGVGYLSLSARQRVLSTA